MCSGLAVRIVPCKASVLLAGSGEPVGSVPYVREVGQGRWKCGDLTHGHGVTSASQRLKVKGPSLVDGVERGRGPCWCSMRCRMDSPARWSEAVQPSNDGQRSLHCLDTRRTLLSYLQAISSFHKLEALFVLSSGQKKGLWASKSSLATWIRLTILETYGLAGVSPPGPIRAHSTRAQAATWSEKGGATPEQICKAATWSHLSTFIRYYRLDLLSSQDFARKVLQAVVPLVAYTDIVYATNGGASHSVIASFV